MALSAALEREVNKLFRAQWRNQSGEKILGDQWAVALTKEESNFPLIGPKEKKTHATVYVLDRNGNIQQKQYDARSRSWVDNLRKIYPDINAWVFIHSGIDPKLR